METKHESLKITNKARYLAKLDGPAEWLSFDDLKALAAYYKEQNITIHVETYDTSLSLDDSVERAEKATKEIHEIQTNLKEGEQVGYLYNNNARDGEKRHAEAFIISKDKITKILHWNLESKLVLNLEEAENSDTRVFFKSSRSLMAQHGSFECGSLAMAHLKNYLSEDAQQLREFTLSIPYYDENQKLRYYFLPSPQVLRYSQLDVYNQFLKGIVQKGPQALQMKGQSKLLVTIEDVLQATKTKAEKLGNKRLVEETETLLQKLPTFRKNWLAEYEKTEAKRNLMQTSEPGEAGWLSTDYHSEYNKKPDEANVYLIYTTRRMRKIVLNQSQENSNPALGILAQYKTNLSEKKSEKAILNDLEIGLQKIKLSKPEDILYFLSKIDTRFYKPILKAISGFPQAINEYKRLGSYFLSSDQEQALIEATKENLKGLISERQSQPKDFRLSEIGNWISFMRLKPTELASFLQSHFDEPLLKDQFKFESRNLFDLRKQFGCDMSKVGKEEFAKLLNHYMPGWLESQFPKLFAEAELNKLVLFIPDDTKREEFINASVSKLNIPDILNKISALEAKLMLINYAKCFADPKKSDVILTNLGEASLLHTLGTGYSSTFTHCYQVLHDYLAPHKAIAFLHKYRGRILEIMINKQSILPLDQLSTFKPNLEFFCPKGDETLKNYFAKNGYDAFLQQIQQFLPVEERELFLSRVSGVNLVEPIIGEEEPKPVQVKVTSKYKNLESEKPSQLLEQLKTAERQSNKDFSLLEIGNWLSSNRVAPSELESFLHSNFEEQWLKDQFNYESSRDLFNLRTQFGCDNSAEGEKVFAKLLNDYMPGWLESQFPRLFADAKLYNSVLFIPDDAQRAQFINASVKNIKNIPELLEIMGPLNAGAALINYARSFKNPKETNVLLANLGEDSLLHTLGQGNDSTFSHCYRLLENYIAPDKATAFLHKNRDRILEIMVKWESILPLDESSPYKGLLKLDFFCPDEDKILKDYFAKNKNVNFLTQILQFLPLEERQLFIDRVSVQELATNQKVSSLLQPPKEEERPKPVEVKQPNLSPNMGSNPNPVAPSNQPNAPVQQKVNVQSPAKEPPINPIWADLILGVSIGLALVAIILIITLATGGAGSPLAILIGGLGAKLALGGAAAFWVGLSLISVGIVSACAGLSAAASKLFRADPPQIEEVVQKSAITTETFDILYNGALKQTTSANQPQNQATKGLSNGTQSQKTNNKVETNTTSATSTNSTSTEADVDKPNNFSL